GGKTSYLAERMGNRGLIVACDRDTKRLGVLEDNLDRLGVKIARIICHDWKMKKIPKEIAAIGEVDRILIDVPCTNTGGMQRRVDVRWRLRPADFVRMSKAQIEIVQSVYRLLRPDGALVYSTCSLEPEENDQVVEQLVKILPGAQLSEKRESRPFRDHLDGAF